MNSWACARRAADLDLRGRRFRAAVANVLGDGPMQQRGVLGHDADGSAQAFLRDGADVLPVDADRSALHVVEAQQQVDQRGLARAAAADESDALAGLHGEVEVVQDACSRILRPAVAEAHGLETDFAARHFQGNGVGRIHERQRPRDAVHAFLHHAHVLEDAAHFPAHPAGHVRDLPGERDGGGDDGGARLTVQP